MMQSALLIFDTKSFGINDVPQKCVYNNSKEYISMISRINKNYKTYNHSNLMSLK